MSPVSSINHKINIIGFRWWGAGGGAADGAGMVRGGEDLVIGGC